ncbi:MAG TPA: hypothetical protein VLT90_00785 [Terriglobales bacterium]|nr:hypothetical protein [Terriglobales bacterium]
MNEELEEGSPTTGPRSCLDDSKLSLSDDQKAKIKPIIEERQQKMQALAGSGGRRRKKAREMKSIMEDSDKKITAVLNDDQKKTYAEVKQQMREQAQDRRHNRNRENQNPGVGGAPGLDAAGAGPHVFTSHLISSTHSRCTTIITPD